MCKQNNIKKHQGFTLVELLVTIAILAVLATVSVVGYTSYIERSAVSADNYFVTQLNGLTRLYEIDHTNNFEESDVRKLLKNAGITSLELKSESYDYQLYFNQNNNKFILTTEDYSNDEKYLLIDDGFLSKNDGDDVVGDNENNEENNPGEVTPPAGGDQEPGEGEKDKNNDEFIEFIFNDQYTSSMVVNKRITLNCYSDQNCINIENYIIYDTDEQDYTNSYYTLYLDEILSIKDEKQNNLPIADIEVIPNILVRYINYNPGADYIIDSENNTVIFNYTGSYTIIVYSDDGNSFLINANVYNKVYNSATLDSQNRNDAYNADFSKNADGTINVALAILNHINLTDTNNLSMEPITELDNEYIINLLEAERLKVKVNSESIDIQLFKNKYCVLINNLSKGTHNYIMDISYMGANGHTLHISQSISIKITVNGTKTQITISIESL